MKLQNKQAEKAFLADQDIIELYWNRDEQAINETDLKYGKYLFKIAFNLLHDRLDCEECLNDTYLGVWRAIPPSRPNAFKAFLTTVTRRVSINRYNSLRAKKAVPSELTVSLAELGDFIADEGDVDADFDAKRLGQVISSFIRSLSSRRRFIFIGRYYAAEPINTIADDLNLSRSTVNKELAAIRKALKEKLESEGYTI